MSRFTQPGSSMAVMPWNDEHYHRVIKEDMKSDEYRQEEALISGLRDHEEIACQELAKAWENSRCQSQVINEQVDLSWKEKARVRAEYAKEVRIYNILQNFVCRNRLSRPTVSYPMEPVFMRDERNASNEFEAMHQRGKSKHCYYPPYK
jgi:hypothetical protein